MDIAALTAFLAPALPVLLHSGQQAVDALAGKLGAEALDHAKRLWGRLRGKVEEKAAAEEAARDVAERPDDPRARAALELQLEKLLATDPDLAAEIAQLWGQAQAAGVVAAGERSVAVGGDVGGIVITGDDNVLER